MLRDNDVMVDPCCDNVVWSGFRGPFCIAQNAKRTESDNQKKGFPSDVIFQNVTVCNF